MASSIFVLALLLPVTGQDQKSYFPNLPHVHWTLSTRASVSLDVHAHVALAWIDLLAGRPLFCFVFGSTPNLVELRLELSSLSRSLSLTNLANAWTRAWGMEGVRMVGVSPSERWWRRRRLWPCDWPLSVSRGQCGGWGDWPHADQWSGCILSALSSRGAVASWQSLIMIRLCAHWHRFWVYNNTRGEGGFFTHQLSLEEPREGGSHAQAKHTSGGFWTTAKSAVNPVRAVKTCWQDLALEKLIISTHILAGMGWIRSRTALSYITLMVAAWHLAIWDAPRPSGCKAFPEIGARRPPQTSSLPGLCCLSPRAPTRDGDEGGEWGKRWRICWENDCWPRPRNWVTFLFTTG